MNQTESAFLITQAIEASLAAGEKILEVYRGRNFKIRLKRDLSPVTLADRLAHEVILRMLTSTGLPILSEEGRIIPFEERQLWQRFWLVDPLDGTKEFIGRNDEFTVNIALVEDGVPVGGVVYAPVTGDCYYAHSALGAFRWHGVPGMSIGDITDESRRIPQVSSGGMRYRVIGSRSHMNRETKSFITRHLQGYPDHETVTRGSSLKLCMIAEGSADLYPRFSPTMEWDTAAGHAIITVSGGTVMQADGSGPLRYNKPDLLNPSFIATAAQALPPTPAENL